MRLLGVTSFALAVAGVAQSFLIGYPPPGAKIHTGRNFTVEIVVPNSIQGPIDVGIAIGLNPCGHNPCPGPQLAVGHVLYSGLFKARLPSSGPYKPPFENFTLEVPSTFPKGHAQLNVVYCGLFGAGPSPTLQFHNETLRVI
ncbi:hypothetical protein AX17_007469 [Amanita inopinata Kibby_2008]|nr:hypothetical protein AX17_007469 [Amanita inopinata Kibby_2008]